mgnify:CR=1 FL=1
MLNHMAGQNLSLIHVIQWSQKGGPIVYEYMFEGSTCLTPDQRWYYTIIPRGYDKFVIIVTDCVCLTYM